MKNQYNVYVKIVIFSLLNVTGKQLMSCKKKFRSSRKLMTFLVLLNSRLWSFPKID
jgi:hypothetical protein